MAKGWLDEVNPLPKLTDYHALQTRITFVLIALHLSRSIIRKPIDLCDDAFDSLLAHVLQNKGLFCFLDMRNHEANMV